MSSVGGISAYGSNAYLWLQGMFAEQSGQSLATTTVSGTTTNSITTDNTSSSGGTSSSASLRSQIQSSILAALETAEQSGDPTNFQTIIGSASTADASGQRHRRHFDYRRRRHFHGKHAEQ